MKGSIVYSIQYTYCTLYVVCNYIVIVIEELSSMKTGKYLIESNMKYLTSNYNFKDLIFKGDYISTLSILSIKVNKFHILTENNSLRSNYSFFYH